MPTFIVKSTPDVPHEFEAVDNCQFPPVLGKKLTGVLGEDPLKAPETALGYGHGIFRPLL